MVSKRHPVTVKMMNGDKSSPFWNDKEKYAGQRQRDLLKLYANKKNSESTKPEPFESTFQFKDRDDDEA